MNAGKYLIIKDKIDIKCNLSLDFKIEQVKLDNNYKKNEQTK